ncbi:glycosyltransferase family 4 protein [Halochromatium roseum]|uniref:glycosyltransferase family 4 protein n=1 Tax=Halochromatium roseum TaxID=391920 RepID=UPI001913A5B9|nr:glycosyltransferase family 1 protein [Halochromatium roseum]MBK5939540.1 glycoside hydrolase [Halochromatium roseum]
MTTPQADTQSPGSPIARPKLHIALVTETYLPEINGVANTLAQIARGLERRGHQVSLVRPRQPADRRRSGAGNTERNRQPEPAELLVGGLPLPGYRGLRFGLPALGKIHRRWRDARPDAVYIATEGPLGHAALQVAARQGIPTLTGFHTQFQQYCSHYGVGLLMRPIIEILKRFHNRSGATLVPTQALRDDLAAAGFKNMHVLSRGVDTERFSPHYRSERLRSSWGCSEDTLVALYVGRIAAEKHIDLAIEAFERIQRVEPNSRCVLVGDGPELAHLRRQHGHHIYTGAKVGEELAAHYASADLFVFPSLTETFGNVLTEALASGVAALAFDYAAAREHLHDDRNGYSVAMGDREAFLLRAEQAASDRTRLRLFGQEARRTAEALSWDPVIRDLEQHLYSVIDCASNQGERHEPIPATAE